jgi:hypothetical protein
VGGQRGSLTDESIKFRALETAGINLRGSALRRPAPEPSGCLPERRLSRP